MMDKPDGLPTSPQAQQQQQDVVNGILTASSGAGIHLNIAANLSNILGPPHNIHMGYGKPYARAFGASVLKLQPRQNSAAKLVVAKSETSAWAMRAPNGIFTNIVIPFGGPATWLSDQAGSFAPHLHRWFAVSRKPGSALNVLSGPSLTIAPKLTRRRIPLMPALSDSV